ncbi:MAG: hypothetical protein AAGA48_14685 [Myxococcota bacterium]
MAATVLKSDGITGRVVQPESQPLLVHQRRLIERRRCPHCAELQPRVTWFQGGTCRYCGGSLTLVASEDHVKLLLARLNRDARTTRIVAYGGVFIATLIVGWVPVFTSVITAVGMVIANLWLVRRPTASLPVQHRMLVRLLVRAWFVVMLALSVEANLIAAPLIAFLGLGIAVSTGSQVLVTGLYVEGALWLVRRRVHRAVARPDGDWGWLALPVGAGLVAVLAFLVGIPVLQQLVGSLDVGP